MGYFDSLRSLIFQNEPSLPEPYYKRDNYNLPKSWNYPENHSNANVLNSFTEYLESKYIPPDMIELWVHDGMIYFRENSSTELLKKYDMDKIRPRVRHYVRLLPVKYSNKFKVVIVKSKETDNEPKWTVHDESDVLTESSHKFPSGMEGPYTRASFNSLRTLNNETHIYCPQYIEFKKCTFCENENSRESEN